MFNGIKIKNFKSLKEVDISLKNLTLFTGINSSGKSSTLQALLLIKQNFQIYGSMIKAFELPMETLKNIFQKLSINGEYLDLGLGKNILYDKAEDDILELQLKLNDGQVNFKSDIRGSREEESINCEMSFTKNIEELFLQNNFTYLSADRIVPQSSYKYSKENVLRENLGKNGEYTIHYLAENKNISIPLKELQHPESNSNQLLENVECWLSKISKGVKVIPEVNINFQNSTLQYSYGGSERLPQNIGFGVTYVLPIIVAILKAKKGDVVIIENPESHLHPSGQVEIARLCAKASEAGVQIIVETHSDHFLNGVRVAIKERILNNDNTLVYYFSRNEMEEKTEVQKIEIDENGKIDEWPRGFFDEWDIQLEKLLW
jgi:predicted ATPase